MKSLSVHVTDLCNSACSFCVVSAPLYDEDTVNLEDVFAFIDKYAAQGYTNLNLHGGEPTIQPRLLELVRRASALGFSEIHMQTNGIRMADATYCMALKEAGVTRCVVSLHGHSAELQDALTGSKGGFRKTICGIRNMCELGVPVRTNTVITKSNNRHLEAIAELAISLGVDHINLSVLHPSGSSVYSRQSNMPRFTEIRPMVHAVIQQVLKAERIITLEGFPLCIVPDHGHLLVTEKLADIRMMIRGREYSSYDGFMSRLNKELGSICRKCECKGACGGVYPQYTEYYGWDEIQGMPSKEASEPALCNFGRQLPGQDED